LGEPHAGGGAGGRSAAGQANGSPYFFPVFGWWSPIFFVTQGYAVLESASIFIPMHPALR
jgi:hypothetical protein